MVDIFVLLASLAYYRVTLHLPGKFVSVGPTELIQNAFHYSI